MEVFNVNDRPAKKIESYPYKGKPYQVLETTIRWLSRVGPEGAPEYGLRFFTIGPGGEVPIHNHLYYQTMYILSGRLMVASYDLRTDEVSDEKVVGPNDVVYVRTMEPHSLRNLSDTEPVHFLCCIANVYEEERS